MLHENRNFKYRVILLEKGGLFHSKSVCVLLYRPIYYSLTTDTSDVEHPPFHFPLLYTVLSKRIDAHASVGLLVISHHFVSPNCQQ